MLFSPQVHSCIHKPDSTQVPDVQLFDFLEFQRDRAYRASILPMLLTLRYFQHPLEIGLTSEVWHEMVILCVPRPRQRSFDPLLSQSNQFGS